MGNQFLKYRKNRLSKSLLFAAVLFSIFAFPPSVDNSKSLKPKPQTEIVCSSVRNILAKTVAYRNLKIISNKKESNPFHKYQAYSLLNYNQYIVVRLLCVPSQSIKFEITANFIQLKTIPKSSDEDNFISITG